MALQALREFEVEVIRLLARAALSEDQRDSLTSFTGTAQYQYTGVGYFLTLRIPTLVDVPTTLSHSVVMGAADGIECGFVVFVEPGELTLECHSWGAVDVPIDFRDRHVGISMPGVNDIDSTWLAQQAFGYYENNS